MSAALEPPATRDDAEVISLIGLAHGTSHFFHLLLPSLFPWFIRDFGLTFTQVGLLTTVFFLVSGVGQALAGFVVDRVGGQRVMLFGIGTLSAAGIITGLAASYPALVFAAAVAGLGNSIFHPADFTLLNRRVSMPRLGHAFSMHGLAGYLGWAAAPVFVTGLAGVWNWHVAAFGAAAVGAAVFALLYVRREIFHDRSSPAIVAPGALPAAQAPVESQFAFLGSAAVWLCFLFFLLTTAGFGILQTYAPTVLGHVYSMPLAFATAGLTAYLLGSAGGIVTGGFVAARFTETDWVIASMLAFAALVALVLAAAVVPAWLAIACMAGMGFGVGVAGPSRDLLVRKAATSQFGKTSYGRVYGFVYSGTDVGLALAPLVIGPVLDAGHFSLALYAVAALQVGAVIGALRVGAQTRVTAMSRAGAK